MKNFQAAFVTAVTCISLLTGCASKSPIITEPETIRSSNLTTEEPSAPNGMVHSKLTNEWIDASLANKRPLAVMIPNEISAIPHYNLSNASILYECNVEAGMTRLLAIFEDYDSLKKIGNIRSLRDYYAYWAFEWDAILCHFGGPYYVDDIMARATTDSLNGNTLSQPFFRSSDRDLPHNAYLNGSQVKAALEKHGLEMYDRGMTDATHYQFADATSPNTLTQYADAESAVFLDMSNAYPVTKCYFIYDEADGLYYRFQHLSGSTEEPHMDEATNKQLAFSNILIQSHDYQVRDQSGYLYYETIDSGQDAWYITQGKLIKCTWEKTSDYGATRYYDSNGEEITLNTGKTMVLIIQDDNTFTYR
jgi:hypothetical protein